MSEKIKKILIHLLYFFITIVALGSMGLWLPFALDKYNLGKASAQTLNSYPGNIITYAFGIFIVALIDRMMHLFKSSRYSNNTIEFLLLLALFGLDLYLIFQSLNDLKYKRLSDSILFAQITMLISWVIWLYVKFREPQNDSLSALGGPI